MVAKLRPDNSSHFHGSPWPLDEEVFLLSDLGEDVLRGFPGIGQMPVINKAVQENFRLHTEMTIEEVHERRLLNNEMVLKKIRQDDEMGPKLLDKTKEDATNGWMSWPRPLRDDDLYDYSLTRRIGVMEWWDHAKEWRLRVVDHATESLANFATWADQRTTNDGCYLLVW